MQPITLEPISLMLGLSAAGGAAVLFALRRLRRGVGDVRDELRNARARALVSDVTLQGGHDALSAALPAVGMMTDAVTALFPVSSPAARSRLLVASPPDSTDSALRAAAALLAAIHVSTAEVPEFGRALRSAQPQRGVDLGALLRRGTTSLPFSTRERLFARIKPLPFVVVPISRPGDGTAVALLLAIGQRQELDHMETELGRAAKRLALLFPSLRKGPQRAAMPGRQRVKDVRPPTPRDAELILWLDGSGDVAACEPLQDEWLVDPPPRSLGDLFGVDATSSLLERAAPECPAALGLARIGSDVLAEVSLLRLADGDHQTWGYAAFLRRVAPPDAVATPSSRSASPPN